MPAQIISKKMRPTHRDIYVVLMDDYGVPMHVSLPVSLSKASRDAKVDAVIATLEAGQASMEAEAISEGLDLTEQKATGTAKREAAMRASGLLVTPASTTTATPTATSPATTTSTK